MSEFYPNGSSLLCHGGRGNIYPSTAVMKGGLGAIDKVYMEPSQRPMLAALVNFDSKDDNQAQRFSPW